MEIWSKIFRCLGNEGATDGRPDVGTELNRDLAGETAAAFWYHWRAWA